MSTVYRRERSFLVINNSSSRLNSTRLDSFLVDSSGICVFVCCGLRHFGSSRLRPFVRCQYHRCDDLKFVVLSRRSLRYRIRCHLSPCAHSHVSARFSSKSHRPERSRARAELVSSTVYYTTYKAAPPPPLLLSSLANRFFIIFLYYFIYLFIYY